MMWPEVSSETSDCSAMEILNTAPGHQLFESAEGVEALVEDERAS